LFDSNYAVTGAAIYLDNGNLIAKNNQMSFNRAVVGGAVYLSCYDTALDNTIQDSFMQTDSDDSEDEDQEDVVIPDELLPDTDSEPNKCTVQIIGTNVFMNNTARDGGAIKWTKDRPLIDKNVTKFINNTATVYGNDIASYPKSV
jgi:predicted outer membrane repeat protein